MREFCVLPDDGPGGDRPSATETTATCVLPAPVLGAGRTDVRISDLIAEKARSKTFFWSVELIPGTTPLLRTLLEQSLAQLARRPPAFVSVTWHASHLQGQAVQGQAGHAVHPALALAARLQESLGVPVLLHLAAGGMSRAHVESVLRACLAAGVNNVFALRGDVKSDEDSDFRNASDLVHFIRKTFGSQFCIGVAGYPSGHPEAKSQTEDLLYFKEKVNAGADFALTQMISTFEEYQHFKTNCEEMGVKISILPGLLLIQSHIMLQRVITTCGIKVPQNILQEIQTLNDNEKETEYGKELFKNLLKKLVEDSCCPGVHLFTLNRVSEALIQLSEVDL